MTDSISFSEIEAKWQEKWEAAGIFKAPRTPRAGKKFYCLDMFPYPSGAGLHVGHPEGYIATDILCRFKRRQGFDVLHPMGWDAFGLPAENFAIQTGRHPEDITRENISNFKRQVKSLGFSYDWDREINTTDPDYYKCTQWIFLQLFKKGLAYESTAPINWCPSCKTGLANEEVFNGVCERCQTRVERKNIRQWTLKITAYAERLEKDLETLDWPHSTLAMQKHWIGKSEGAEIDFKTEPGDVISIFTTRPDTLYGVTYLVLSPEHALSLKLASSDKAAAISAYIDEAKNKAELERSDLQKDKTGVFTGSYAVHPLTGKKIPIWIADYVLGSYGTGAVMAVPAHDARDFAFAKKFGLPIIPVVRPLSGLLEEVREYAYVEDGTAVNSPAIEGLPTATAKEKMVQVLEEKGLGKKAVQYRLRDWIFSRQRYWGEPIPIIHCEKCGAVPVPENELPVLLPHMTHYKPTDTGESPLANVDSSWLKAPCPSCGKTGKRETNTMPQWAGSCWYYLRFLDPKNKDLSWSPDIEKAWMPVDVYVGGSEHAVLHLLYARFWHKVLFDQGAVSTLEPFQKLRHQGLILSFSYRDSNGVYHPYEDVSFNSNGEPVLSKTGEKLSTQVEKMSKSKKNVVSPDSVIARYGADVFRIYEMFMGPFEQSKPWDMRSIEGSYRFLRKIWTMVYETEWGNGEGLLSLRNRTIKKVTEDIEGFGFNTVVSTLMIYANEIHASQEPAKIDIETLLSLLNPLAPHISEELWAALGHQDFLARQAWPSWDERYLEDDKVEYVIQLNGKNRETLTVSKSVSQEYVKSTALSLDKIKTMTEGKEIVKTIVVPHRLVNIVVKEKIAS